VSPFLLSIECRLSKELRRIRRMTATGGHEVVFYVIFQTKKKYALRVTAALIRFGT
jgi:hypothetical protein